MLSNIDIIYFFSAVCSLVVLILNFLFHRYLVTGRAMLGNISNSLLLLCTIALNDV